MASAPWVQSLKKFKNKIEICYFLSWILTTFVGIQRNKVCFTFAEILKSSFANRLNWGAIFSKNSAVRITLKSNWHNYLIFKSTILIIFWTNDHYYSFLNSTFSLTYFSQHETWSHFRSGTFAIHFEKATCALGSFFEYWIKIFWITLVSGRILDSEHRLSPVSGVHLQDSSNVLKTSVAPTSLNRLVPFSFRNSEIFSKKPKFVPINITG